ncbi:MAG: arginine repressor [Phycisphaerae bacterium]|nr:MAG: arginine repressor [Phycisphaerae bacterium]
MPAKAARHAVIRRLIAEGAVRSQEHLADLLSREGVAASQGTLSRDLRDLGVLKGPDGYTLASPGEARGEAPRELQRAIRERLLSVDQAGSLVVLRTAPGHASALAVEVDRSRPAGVVGTVAGDDTVFVAAGSPAKAHRLTGMIRALAAPGTGRERPARKDVL